MYPKRETQQEGDDLGAKNTRDEVRRRVYNKRKVRNPGQPTRTGKKIKNLGEEGKRQRTFSRKRKENQL